jgi:hypothetical protein
MSPALVRSRFAGILAFLIILALPACDRSDLKSRTDANQRIQFLLPQDWEAVTGSGETRFHPPGSAAIQIQINTTDGGPGGNLARQRDAWLDFQSRSGQEVLVNEDLTTEYFEGVAYAHTAETTSGEKIWHHVLLDGGDFTVATYLQTPPDQYEEFLPIFRRIVSSIQPVSE